MPGPLLAGLSRNESLTPAASRMRRFSTRPLPSAWSERFIWGFCRVLRWI